MAGFDPSLGHRSGERSDATFPDAPWSWTAPQSAQLVASPVVADGVIVVGAMDGNVYGLAATTGRPLWQFSTGDAIQGTPAVLDGRVFVASLDGNLYALHLADGRVAWQKALGGLGRASPVVAAGSLIVARGFPGNTLLRLDPRSGDTMWESAADTLAPFSNSAAASDGTRLIIGANEGHYVAFDLTTGKKQWTYEAEGIVNLSAPLLTGGRAYFLPGGASGRLHAVDATTGAAIAGWPIDLPAPAPDITGVSLGRQFAVSSIAAAGSRLIVDLRIDDSLDTDKDGVADQFLMRETVLAVDTLAGAVAWQQANGRKLVSSFNDLPKYWLCPTPAVYQRFGGAASAAPLALAASTLTSSVRAFDSATGAVLGTLSAAGPSGASPILANGRAFVTTKDGALQSWLSRSNHPPATPALTGGTPRAVNNVAPIIRWASTLDPEGQPVTYQVRLDSDGEILESWAQATTTGDLSWHVPGDLDLGRSYVVAVRARDSQGAWSDWSAPQTLAVETTPPVSLGGSPQPSLAAALQAAQPGQVISLGAGTMRLGETVRVPAGVTMEGAGPQRTILDATGRDTGVALDGSAAGQPTQVRGLTVSGARTGVSVGSVHDARLTNVIVRDSSDAGIDVGAAGAAVLRNGTLVGNGQGAVSFGTLLVKNSLVLGNQVGLVAGNADALVSQFNDLSGNAVADYQGLTGAATDLAAPVSFLDFDGRDLHLAPRQASTDQGDPTDDASAEPSPNGGRINLGAFGGTSEAELSAPPAQVTPPPTDGTGGSGGPDTTPPPATPANPDPGSPAPTSPAVPGSPSTPTSPATPAVPVSPEAPASPAAPTPAAPPPAAGQPSPLTPGPASAGTTAGGCAVASEGAGSGHLAGTMTFLALAFISIRRGRRRSRQGRWQP